VDEATPALRYSRAAVVASGTATVEAAIVGTPFVMVYRVSPLTYALGKPRIKVPHFAMVNLIAGEQVVSELIQHDFTPDRVVTELQKILPDGIARSRMIEGLARVKALLNSGDPNDRRSAPQRAAEAVLAFFPVEPLSSGPPQVVATRPPNLDSN
jgi:lipid-A-disaccharide synthase